MSMIDYTVFQVFQSCKPEDDWHVWTSMYHCKCGEHYRNEKTLKYERLTTPKVKEKV